MTNIEDKYRKVGFDVKKEGGEVHFVQGPLRVETSASEADSTFILHQFFLKIPILRSSNEGRFIGN